MRFKKTLFFVVVAILLLSIYYLLINANSLTLEAGKTDTIWVQSQNGNDDEALLSIKSKSGTEQEKLKYTINKYAEVGVISLPDIQIPFPEWIEGVKLKDIKTAVYSREVKEIDKERNAIGDVDSPNPKKWGVGPSGISLIDMAKPVYEDIRLKSWKIYSLSDNVVRLKVWRKSSNNSWKVVGESDPASIKAGPNSISLRKALLAQKGDYLGFFALAGNIPQNSLYIKNNEGKIFSLGDVTTIAEQHYTDRFGDFSFKVYYDVIGDSMATQKEIKNTAKIGLTIIDHNKTSFMDGGIRYWKVVSKENNNEVRIGVFRYDSVNEKYILTDVSPPRIAGRGLNFFYEEIPLPVKQNDVIGLFIEKPVAINRVNLNERGTILTRPGFSRELLKTKTIEDGGNGSFSYSALLDFGEVTGEVLGNAIGDFTLKLPQKIVYGHLSWYKISFQTDGAEYILKPGIASFLLNDNLYIGLIRRDGSPWTPKAFSLQLLVSLLLLFISAWWTISHKTRAFFLLGVAGILSLFALSRYFIPYYSEFQFVTIISSYVIIFLIPGIIISRFFSRFSDEAASGRVVYTFVSSLVFWVIPSFGLFLVKSSYWPFIAVFFLLICLLFFKTHNMQRPEDTHNDLPLAWRVFSYFLWCVVIIIAVHTLFSTRFHAELFDTFHHISLMTNFSDLPIIGDAHPNLYGLNISYLIPYAYNLWGLLIGTVVKISGQDIGTIYCVGNGLLVLLMFTALWWVIGLLIHSMQNRTIAFFILIIIYLIRTFATFAPIFQKTEFAFMMYPASVNEFFLYIVYVVLGIKTLNRKSSYDLFIFCGLSIAIMFLHLEFTFINSIILLLIAFLSLWGKNGIGFKREQLYFISIIAFMITLGFIIKNHLEVKKIADSSSPYYGMYYGLRYAEYPIIKKFLYLTKDMFDYLRSYVWNFISLIGGLILFLFASKRVSNLYRPLYIIIALLLLIRYNPIVEMICTPILTSWPVKRIDIYSRSMMLVTAGLVISISLSIITNWLKKFQPSLAYAVTAIFLFSILSVVTLQKHWLSKIASTMDTITFNRGNYLDITYFANLPEVRFLNKYDKRQDALIAEYPYYYAIPSLTGVKSFYHTHYPDLNGLPMYAERQNIWKECMIGEVNCKAKLPQGTLILVRHSDTPKFVKIGHEKLFVGKMFTVLQI